MDFITCFFIIILVSIISYFLYFMVENAIELKRDLKEYEVELKKIEVKLEEEKNRRFEIANKICITKKNRSKKNGPVSKRNKKSKK